MHSGTPQSEPVSAREFATTHWSVVLAARNNDTPGAQAALERLCQVYWPPLYAYLRRFGCSPEDAEDLTQDFFAHFLKKEGFSRAEQRRGRFRTFLLTCLQHYVQDVHDRQTALKRGGLTHVLSLDREQAELGYAAEPVEHMTPERLFEKHWAITLLEHVVAQVGTEFNRTGKREFFDQLKGYLWGEGAPAPAREIAARFGVGESAVKVTIHRLRHRFRELLRLEIAHTVTRPEEIDEEIRYLAQVLREE